MFDAIGKAVGGFVGGVAESIADTATEIGVAAGFADKEPCTISVDSKTGQATADIDYSDIPKEHRASVRANADALATAVTTLKEQLAEAKADGASPRELAALTGELEKAENMLTDFKFECEINGMNPLEIIAYAALGPIGGAVVDSMVGNDADLAKLEEMNQAAQQFEAALGESKASGEIMSPGDLNSKGVEGTASSVGMTQEPSKSANLAKAGIEGEGSETGGADGGSGGGGKTDGLSGPSKSGSELYALLKSDPEALQKELEAAGAQGSFIMQTAIQEHIQSMNRMFSTMSNIMKAEHDTQKAIINNFRV
jgi:hypothetical protein